MSFINKSVIYARKLSVFFLFIVVFAVFFGVYFYKFIPGNRDDLTKRGFRILKQFSKNIIQKHEEVNKTFSSINLKGERADSALESFINKTDPAFKKLNENLPYQVYEDTANKNIVWKNGLVADSNGLWVFHYSANILIGANVKKHLKENPKEEQKEKTNEKSRKKYCVTIKAEDFLNPILETRKDLFESYMLLSAPIQDSSSKNNNSKERTNKNDHSIVYKQDDFTFSSEINMDTVLSIRKNTDFENVIKLDIAGRICKVFICPFNLGNQKFVLAGIIPNEAYEKEIKSTPQGVIPIVIIVILLILISLPFVKIFLLSPKELIGKKDVMFASLSLFLGSSLIVFISFYLLLEHTSHLAFNNRLKDIRTKIKKEIESEFDAAHKQLKFYQAKYHDHSFADGYKQALLYRYQNDHKKKLDSLFSPGIYKNVKRVFWVNDPGQTLAKWNPFDFEAPFSNVSGLDFFKMLKEKSRLLKGEDIDSLEVIYAGKSIVTGEFLLYIAKRDTGTILINNNFDNKSYAIVMPFYLNCSEHPVLPPEFGFCLVDNRGKVLVHSDPEKNLSENIILETGENKRLQNCIQYKNEDLINNITLYGEPAVIGVTPINNQALTLVVFYNKNLLFNNSLRLLHFSVESLAYLYLALIICLLFSTGLAASPSKLRFKVNKAEWIRPSNANAASYEFTFLYFLSLGIFTVLLFAGVLMTSLDLRIIFSVSLLLPLYTLLGYITSRKNVIGGMSITIAFILLFNAVIFITLAGFSNTGMNIFFIVLFQVVTISLLIICSKRGFKKTGEDAFITMGIEERTKSCYRFSLYLGMYLIGIVPAVGILIYGYQSEKIQFKKYKQLAIASAYGERRNFISNQLIPDYKDPVKQEMVNSYLDSLKKKTGIYLSDKDQLEIVNGENNKAVDTFPLCDEPYATMMDNVFLISGLEFKSYSIKDKAKDSLWFFKGSKKDSGKYMTLFYNEKHIDSFSCPSIISVTSAINNPLSNFWNLSIILKIFILLCVSIFAFFSYYILKATAKRIFLMHYIYKNKDYISSDIVFMNRHFMFRGKPGDSYQNFIQVRKAKYDKEEYNEEHIIADVRDYKGVFRSIWGDLPNGEQYFAYEFAKDGYANYKDADTLYSLIHKGIIVQNKDRFELFDPSFRQYLLCKKGSTEVNRLRVENATPGLWQTIRIPVLVIIAVMAIFMFITQEDFSHQFTAIVTSMAALIPLLLGLFQKFKSNGSGNK